MTNILLVDDERRMLDLLALYLESAGYHCTKESSGKSAIECAANGSFDLVLLDVMMPEIDGWKVCQEIRRFSNIPIIMLTARGQSQDMIFGLKNGADDYITKPFEEQVLLARIEALLRRNGKTEPLHFHDLQLDREKFELHVGQEKLIVTPIEFKLLELFLENQNLVFSREHLIEKIWDFAADVDNRTVDSHIRNLREKLREKGFSVDVYLKTVYGVGYKWQA